MLKCNVTKGHSVRVKANGIPHELMLETAMVIQTVYNGLLVNPEAAQEYKNKLIGVLLAPETPVWKEIKK